MDLAGIGVWAFQLRYGDPGEVAEAAAELEQLGYAALWFPDVGGDVFAAAEHLLGRTSRVVVATGILNLWMHEATEVAARRAAWSQEWRDRFLCGIGVGHAGHVDQQAGRKWERPLAMTREYLDALDAADSPLPSDARVLAALGPRMLELARDRASGAHPYNVSAEHSAQAREILGPGPLLAPGHAVVLETDPSTARQVAREAYLGMYLQLPNYANNLLRLGFTDDDLRDGGSNRLVDAIVAWGDAETVAGKVRQHIDAGADHVAIQVVTTDRGGIPLPAYRELAAALVT